MIGTPGGSGPSPAARLLGLVLLVGSTAAAPLDIAALSASLGVTVTVGAITRPPARWLAARAALGALAVSAVVLPWAVSDQWQHGAMRGARSLECILMALAIASTLHPQDVALGLRALGTPEAFVRVVAAMLRQASGLADQGRRLVLARRLRGASGPQVGPEVLAALFDRSIRRAQQAELAERLRAPPSFRSPRWVRLGARDAPWLTGAMLLAAAPHLVAWVAK